MQSQKFQETFIADPDLAMYNMQGTILTDHETPIIRNSGRSDIQLEEYD